MNTQALILVGAAVVVGYLVISDRSDRRAADQAAATASAEAQADIARAQAAAAKSQNSLWGVVQTAVTGVVGITMGAINGNGAAAKSGGGRTDPTAQN